MAPRPRHLIMPDVGDVLGEESLAEMITDWHFAHEEMPLGSEEEEVDGIRRVLYEVWDEQTFMSLSPPPTDLHLLILSDDGTRFDEESLEHWLSSTTLSSLWLVMSMDENVPWLCNLLRNLPPNCNLRSLALIGLQSPIRIEVLEMEKIVDAFCESPACKLDSLSLDLPSFAFLSPQYASKLGRKCRSLFLRAFPSSSIDDSYANSLVDFMSLQTADCKLQELGLATHWGLEEAARPFFVEHVRVLNKMERCKQLKRVDMRGLPPLGADGMSLLVASVASPSCSIQDLGLNLASTPDHFNKTRFLILAQAFQYCGSSSSSSSSSLSKLKVLRFSGVDTDEAAACVVQILGSPQTTCKVRFLDIQILPFNSSNALYEPFFKRLHQAINKPRIQCLRLRLFGEAQSESELASLSDFLGQEHCSLLWLQCILYHRLKESLQMNIANALEANFLLTSLQITPFDSPAARSRATAFLDRNRLYKAMGLSKEDHMKPNVARLFLCGHGEVGKTTLRKALFHLNPTSSPSTSTLQPYHDCRFNMCFQPCKRSTQHVEPRTRGLEIHQLDFEPDQKLVMFDLGGQPDYHIFHHYFMTNTSHDIFIIVSRYTPNSTKASQLASELEYWLRFIVSHRNSAQGPKPRIMLVVNFFHATSSRPLLAEMKDTAFLLTQDLLRKYGEQLDFGVPADHVFGIVAIDASQARPILEKLKNLIADLLNHKPMIPKLCNDLLSHTLPLLAKQKKQYTWGFGCRLHSDREGKTTFKKVIVDYTEVKEQYVQQLDQAHQTEGEVSKLEKRIQAALIELHNIGQVVFFPPIAMSKQAETSQINIAAEVNVAPVMPNEVHSGADSTTSSLHREGMSPIIVDPNWFCNKVIGDLIAPQDLSGKFEWTDVDIKQILLESGCAMQYVDEGLRYMLSLDLCYTFYDDASKQNAAKTRFFFPAVAREKKLHWPPNFKSQKAIARDSHSMHFYGRRIKCKDTERHLIPSGVFSRLQVKLQNFCGVGSDRSYRLGYHWASFVKNSVDVMVRFGRVAATKSVMVDDDQASITEELHTLPIVSINMEEDDHPQWIDILLCCPSSQDAQVRGASVEYDIMQHIKKLIFDICQATSRGIPTVVLEEYALRHEAQEDGMSLMEIEEFIRENGLASDVPWENQQRTSVVDLLLPEELQHHVVSHVQAIQQIQGEFPASTLQTQREGGLTSNEDNIKEGEDPQLLYPQLHGEFKVLFDLINSKLDRNFERLGAKMDNVLALVREIKQDVHKVMRGLQQVEVNIVAKCSTGLLEQLLVQGVLPTYSYLTNAEGKMERLKNVLLRRKAIVHFLCESPTHGPHIVEGQAGREVVVEKGVLMKWAPFLVPSLMVVCCAARLAANAYLPGVAPLFFNPLLDCLKSIGITDEDLKSQIMPKALNALFDQLDIKIQGLYDQKTPFININEEQRKEGIEALQKILGSIEDLDVQRDFGLYLVQVGRTGAKWLCREHAEDYKKLKHRPNPFHDIAK